MSIADQAMQERHTYTSAIAVVPADATNIPPTWGGLYVGGTGNLVVTTIEGQLATFNAVPAGAIIPIVATKVMTATTATNIVGMR